MNTYIAILLIIAATATNTLLAWAAFSYHVMGHGLHPAIAAALGVAVTVGVLITLAHTGMKSK